MTESGGQRWRRRTNRELEDMYKKPFKKLKESAGYEILRKWKTIELPKYVQMKKRSMENKSNKYIGVRYVK